MKRSLCAAVLCTAFALSSSAADWPMWRHDTSRSGATDEQLPAKLTIQWVRTLPSARPAWPGLYDLDFDALYTPIVLGKVLYLPSTRNDSVTAIDTGTGGILWQYFAGGPVRLAPVGHKGRLYFGCDDGHIYCLDAAKGELVWKLDAAPSSRRVMGNDRLISIRPIRGGPVLQDSRLYFTTGIWPFEGVFLHSLDIDTAGSAPPSRCVSVPIHGHPQGYLAARGGKILVPINRAQPIIAGPDISTMKPPDVRIENIIREKSRGCFVAGTGPWLFHGRGIYHEAVRRAVGKADKPVFTGKAAYTTTIRTKGRFDSTMIILAFDLSQ